MDVLGKVENIDPENDRVLIAVPDGTDIFSVQCRWRFFPDSLKVGDWVRFDGQNFNKIQQTGEKL